MTYDYVLLTIVVWMLGIGIYVVSIALVGRSGNARVEQVSVGFGPVIFRTTRFGFEFRIMLLPFGGFTKFADTDANDGSQRVAWNSVSIPVRGMAMLAGPLSSLILGGILLAIPVILGADGLAATTAAESDIRPCAVVGLAFSARPATWRSQGRLIEETAGESLKRLVTFQAMDGRGGLIGFFITAGAIGKVSTTGWSTAVGILLLMHGLLNLLPIPCLIGFSLLHLIYEWAFSKNVPEHVLMSLTYLGLMVILIFNVRLLWIDARWLYSLMWG